MKKTSKRLMHQKIALAIGLTLIFALTIWMLSILVIEAPKGEYQEGVHYKLLENPRRIRGDKVEIMEFFSFGCIHCYNFEPEISEWIKSREDTIRFVRAPFNSSELWRVLARTYYSMEELGILEKNHYPFFVEIHGRGRNMSDPERIAKWIDGKNTSAEAFSKMYDSTIVTNRMRQGDRLQRRFRIDSVPTLVVNGKYIVSNAGFSRMLEVADYLVEKELKEKELKEKKSTEKDLTDS